MHSLLTLSRSFARSPTHSLTRSFAPNIRHCDTFFTCAWSAILLFIKSARCVQVSTNLFAAVHVQTWAG
jgi:hypothetical protein